MIASRKIWPGFLALMVALTVAVLPAAAQQQQRRPNIVVIMKKRLLDAGGDPLASTPAEYAQNIQREEGKWQAVIKKLGLVINN